jgi:hypothetical protein
MTAFAQFTTAGDGKTYNIHTLAGIEGTGIVAWELSENEPPTYQLSQNITIANGDKFVMDDGIDLLFEKNVTLTIEGEADFNLTNGSSFDSATDYEEPLNAAVRIAGTTTTQFNKCTFYEVGLQLMSEGATNMNRCSFYCHDGSSAAALYFISAGAASTIENCYFEWCAKAAIGSAANASQPLTIKNCTFEMNSAANNNVPQINITAAKPLTIEGCAINGNSVNNMVGGIGISNFMSYDADITISNCEIRNNRYGIGLVGPAASIRIKDCTLVNNCYETNPMNGGSGISLYDPYKQTKAVISGNHIEGSLWGVTIIGCQDVNLGCLNEGENYNPGGNVFKNNGNNGELYDLYNNSTLTVYAQNNTWNVSEQTEEQIESVIFHKHDNASLGEVIFMPAANTTDIKGITVDKKNDSIFDLQGRKTTATQKGIYIVNGKKVVR